MGRLVPAGDCGVLGGRSGTSVKLYVNEPKHFECVGNALISWACEFNIGKCKVNSSPLWVSVALFQFGQTTLCGCGCFVL